MSDSYSFCNLNAFEFWLIIRLYVAASIPLILATYYILNNKVSYSTSRVLIYSFIIVAIGWEIWLTYGIAGGLPVDERRSVALSCAIPQNLNWLLNSLADILIIWSGIFLVKRFYSNRPEKFGEHSGLGLNIVKNLIDLHGGKIIAGNNLNKKGAKIEIIFPNA